MQFLLGVFGTSNLNSSQESAYKECPKQQEGLPKWQEELLKLAIAPKPIAIQRVGTLKSNAHQTSLQSQDHGLASQSLDSTNQKGPCTSPCTTESIRNVINADNNSCNREENENKVENLITHKENIPSENVKDSIKSISIDLQGVKLSNYPVIDKVVAEDLILFQVRTFGLSNTLFRFVLFFTI